MYYKNKIKKNKIKRLPRKTILRHRHVKKDLIPKASTNSKNLLSSSLIHKINI